MIPSVLFNTPLMGDYFLEGFTTGLTRACCFAPYAVLPGYTGILFELTRMDDSVVQTWPVHLNRLPDIAAINAWAGSSQIYVSKGYDQFTGTALFPADANNFPELNFSGWPSVGGRSQDFDLGGVNSPLADMFKGAALGFLLMNRVSGDPRRYQGDSQLAQWSINANGNDRFTLMFTAGVHEGPPGGSSTSGRQLDGDTLFVCTTLDALDQTWRLQSGQLNLTAGTLTVRLDDRKQVDSPGFSPPGTTSNTNSRRQFFGTFQGQHNIFFAASGRLFTDNEFATMVSRVPDMTTFPSDKTFSFYPARLSWHSFPYAGLRNGILTTGFCDRQSRAYIAQRPGELTLITNTFHVEGVLSDHVAPPHIFNSLGNIWAGSVGHSTEAAVRLRVGTSSSLANLGPETVLPQGTGGAEYFQFRQYQTKVVIFSQEDNRAWGVHVCDDDTANPPVFATWQKTVISTTNTIYLWGGRKDTQSLWQYTYKTPLSESNNITLHEINMATGSVSANGVALGNWSGATEGGKTLPVNIDTLPVIYQTPAGKAIRVLDSIHDGLGVLFVEYNFTTGVPIPDLTLGNYYYLAYTGTNPYNSTHWTRYLITAAGATFDPENGRWPGMCFANYDHTGIEINLCRRDGVDVKYFAETWRSIDGGANWTSSRDATRNNILAFPVSPVENDGSVRYLACWINEYDNLDSDSSRQLLLGVS